MCVKRNLIKFRNQFSHQPDTYSVFPSAGSGFVNYRPWETQHWLCIPESLKIGPVDLPLVVDDLRDELVVDDPLLHLTVHGHHHPFALNVRAVNPVRDNLLLGTRGVDSLFENWRIFVALAFELEKLQKEIYIELLNFIEILTYFLNSLLFLFLKFLFQL